MQVHIAWNMWGGVARGEKLAECPSMGLYWDIQRESPAGFLALGIWELVGLVVGC